MVDNIMSTPLERLIDLLALDVNISDDFKEACDHPYSCRCDKCLALWARVGPDAEDGLEYGPFSLAEIEAYRETEQHGR